LNDLGFAQRTAADAPGEFAVARNAVAIMPRTSELGGRAVRIAFASGIQSIEIGKTRTETLQLESPLLTALMSAGREKRRRVPLATIPMYVQQAVLAIEDQGFYSHPASIRSG
jgi:membrane peptidoglycan carboxypeptidase